MYDMNNQPKPTHIIYTVYIFLYPYTRTTLSIAES